MSIPFGRPIILVSRAHHDGIGLCKSRSRTPMEPPECHPYSLPRTMMIILVLSRRHEAPAALRPSVERHITERWDWSRTVRAWQDVADRECSIEKVEELLEAEMELLEEAARSGTLDKHWDLLSDAVTKALTWISLLVNGPSMQRRR